MLLSRIKRMWLRFAGKKRRGNSYVKSEMHLSALPGQSHRPGGHYTQRKNRLARFRQMVLAKKQQANRHGYKTPVSSRKMFFKLGGYIAMALTFVIFMLAGGGGTILTQLQSISFFQVSGIVFTGADAASEQKLRKVSGIMLHQTSLIGLDCAQVEKALIAVPWVARAEVKRDWPSTVEISIVENVPVALLYSKGPGGTQLQYVNKHGLPFLQVKPGADIDFPVITGLAEISEPVVRDKALAEALIFLDSVNGNDPYLPAQSVSEIHLNRDGEMVVFLVEYPFPIFFGHNDTSKKYTRLVLVLKALYKKQKGKELISQVEYIQMDYLHDKVLVARNESG